MFANFIMKHGKTINAALYILIFFALLAFVMIAPFKYGCSEKTAWIQAAASIGMAVWLVLAKRIFRTFQDPPASAQ